MNQFKLKKQRKTSFLLNKFFEIQRICSANSLSFKIAGGNC
jgi:hypothetical protein